MGISRRTFIWSYKRGTIQYDIICILILAFVLLIPRGCFIKNSTETSAVPQHPNHQAHDRNATADLRR